MGNEHLWWQEGAIYQIYPRSFNDSNGNGIGDLVGITQKLDYLNWLGVEAIWLSPIYPSPMIDFGYDISDYTNVHPIFGTMDEFDQMLQEVHSRGMKLILDLVPNHTSDQHAWFQESRSSRENPKRDWYIWADPGPGGEPPNNWRSEFGGSAWEWDEQTQQYYYHAFFKEQPDLNWRNPEVQEAMFNVMRFWLDKGIDGFRIDVLWHVIKDKQLRDNPKNPDYDPETDVSYDKLVPTFNADQPEVHEIAAKMRTVTEEYESPRVLIGEIYLPIAKLVAYYGEEGQGIHLPFNFHLLLSPWKVDNISAVITEYEAALPVQGWPNWVLSNHDQPRVGSRAGKAQRRVAAMLLLTLRGTPTLYYGDEIGMIDVEVPPEQTQDPKELRIPNLPVNRDPARTPMQWNDGPNAGFTAGTPWLPVSDDYKRVNVAARKEDPTSILHLFHELIHLRRSEPALSTGRYVPFAEEEFVLAYIRETKEKDPRYLIALNFSHEPQTLSLENQKGHIVLDTHLSRTKNEAVAEQLNLKKDEGVIIQLEEEK